jgi:hypothetical protein
LTFADHVAAHRVCADAQPGASVKFLAGHLDLRRRNLAVTGVTPSPEQNRPHKGRALAIATALANFCDADTAHQPIDHAAFEFLLRESFGFVDQLPPRLRPEAQAKTICTGQCSAWRTSSSSMRLWKA